MVNIENGEGKMVLIFDVKKAFYSQKHVAKKVVENTREKNTIRYRFYPNTICIESEVDTRH